MTTLLITKFYFLVYFKSFTHLLILLYSSHFFFRIRERECVNQKYNEKQPNYTGEQESYSPYHQLEFARHQF